MLCNTNLSYLANTVKLICCKMMGKNAEDKLYAVFHRVFYCNVQFEHYWIYKEFYEKIILKLSCIFIMSDK